MVRTMLGMNLHVKVILLYYKKLVLEIESVVLCIKLTEIHKSECKTKPMIVDHKCFLFNNCRTAKN